MSRYDSQGISHATIEWQRPREPDDEPFKPVHGPDEGDWEEMPNGTWIWTRREK